MESNKGVRFQEDADPGFHAHMSLEKSESMSSEIDSFLYPPTGDTNTTIHFSRWNMLNCGLRPFAESSTDGTWITSAVSMPADGWFQQMEQPWITCQVRQMLGFLSWVYGTAQEPPARNQGVIQGQARCP